MHCTYTTPDEFFSAAAIMLTDNSRGFISRHTPGQPDLFAEITAVTAGCSGKLLQKELATLSSEVLETINYALCYKHDIAMAIYKVLQRTLIENRNVLTDYHDADCVLTVKAGRAVARELQLYRGICRFEPYTGFNCRTAFIAPESDLAWQLALFFAEKNLHDHWVIFDSGRNCGFQYNGKKQLLTKINGRPALPAPPDAVSQSFRHYIKKASVGTRQNLRCQRNFVPHKHRTFLTEFQL
jgi:probable DNA metabolism protein